CFLAFQERGKFLRLAVGKYDRVVFGMGSAVVRPYPCNAIAAQKARFALDLNEEQPAGRKYQQVYLVDSAIIGDKLEICPDPVRIDIRETLSHIVERFPFPGKLRRADLLPAL